MTKNLLILILAVPLMGCYITPKVMIIKAYDGDTQHHQPVKRSDSTALMPRS